jgi:heat-inducible transcriptional repressor
MQNSMEIHLTERQKEILGYVVNEFIHSATPIGSKTISQHLSAGLSAASIRNTLAELEEMGYLTHPHTSAGRVPTDAGYRIFVDSLMGTTPPTKSEMGSIKRQLDGVPDIDKLFRQTAKLLGEISHQLSVVSTPHLKSGVLEHLELISVSSNKIFVVLTIKSGIVKTITMEVITEISHTELVSVARMLNERLHGLTLETIRDTFADRVKDVREDSAGLISLFIRSVDKIFDDTVERERLHIGGTQSLVEQPEYENPDNVRNILDVINNEGALIKLLDRSERQIRDDGVAISIGEEHSEAQLKNYSIVISVYNVENIQGSIGVIGPKRMNYAKVVPLVHYLAEEVSSSLR